MARPPYRFYYPGKIAAGEGEIELPPGESHHLLRVLRIAPGKTVAVFDRDGRVWQGVTGETKGDLATVRELNEVVAPPPPQPEVSIAMSLLKRRAMDWTIEKLSELNVASMQPLMSKRTVVEPPDLKRGFPPDRWTRLALASAKQSGRPVPLHFHPPTPLNQWLKRERPRMLACFAHQGPGSVDLGRWLSERAGMGLPVLVGIGPEGGWTPGEAEAFQEAGFQAVSLGPLTLRAETAAIAVAAACRIMLGKAE